MTKSNENATCYWIDYLIQLHPKTLKSAFSSSKIKLAKMKTKCRLEVMDTMLSRVTAPGHLTKFSIVRVYGPDVQGINHFNNLIEYSSSAFRQRKKYKEKGTLSSLGDNVKSHLVKTLTANQISGYSNVLTNKPEKYKQNIKNCQKNIKSISDVHYSAESTKMISSMSSKDRTNLMTEMSTSENTVFMNVSLETASLLFAKTEEHMQLLEIFEEHDTPTDIESPKRCLNEKESNPSRFKVEKNRSNEVDFDDDIIDASSQSCSLTLKVQNCCQATNYKEIKFYEDKKINSPVVYAAKDSSSQRLCD